jgi:hypothetical protein
MFDGKIIVEVLKKAALVPPVAIFLILWRCSRLGEACFYHLYRRFSRKPNKRSRTELVPSKNSLNCHGMRSLSSAALPPERIAGRTWNRHGSFPNRTTVCRRTGGRRN